MKRQQKILVGLLAAAITFGSLYALAGEKYFAKYPRRFSCHDNWRHDTDAGHWYRDGERPTPHADSIHIH